MSIFKLNIYASILDSDQKLPSAALTSASTIVCDVLGCLRHLLRLSKHKTIPH